jgi:hypothetical protein
MPRKLLSIFALLAASVLAQTNSTRVFVLRTYHCNEGGLDAFKARFRDHSVESFKRRGIESIARVDSVFLDSIDFSPLK